MLRICFIAVCLAVLGIAAAPVHAAPRTSINAGEDKIKVLLSENKPAALVEVRGGYRIYDARTGSKIGFGLLGKAYPVEPVENGLRWGEMFPDVYQITIVPDDGVAILVNGIEYPGSVSCYNVSKKISIVNTVTLDDYVASVLSGQFSATLAPEVMNAIVIAARTEAYYLAKRAPEAPWQVSAKEVGYAGGAVTRRGNGVDDAVASTQGIVMKRVDNGEPFAARWTGHCAGRTACADVIYRRELNASIAAVKMPIAAADRENATWSFVASKDELQQAFNMKNVTGMTPFVDKDSGKVYNLRVSDGKKTRDFDFLALQAVLGARLKSSEFSVALAGDKATFAGVGEGPGVGICLYSAGQMAGWGKDAGQILSEFFPDSKLVHLE